MNQPKVIEYKKPEDGVVSIATASSRFATRWRNRQMPYSEFVKSLSETTRTKETFAEYKAMTRQQQAQIKDVGGFVGGVLKDGRRKADMVIHRSMICLDFDNLMTMSVYDFIDMVKSIHPHEFLLYTTHSHSPRSNKVRLVYPLARTVGPEEYEAVARWVANEIGLDLIDPTTFQPERMMFYPSTSSDGEFIFERQVGDWLDPDTVLNNYLDWRDTSFWPGLNEEHEKIRQKIDKQQDPLTKKGLIGAYCREYSITDLLHGPLKDVYEPTSKDDRYTYKAGTAAGGLVVYDDKFAYSHHATDPISGELVNAFDLMRIHLFGDKDEEAKPKTPVHRMPSFLAMSEYAAEDPAVRVRLVSDGLEVVEQGLDFDEPEEKPSDEWMAKLTVTKSGIIESSVRNIRLIIENDPKLKGKIAKNTFANRDLVVGDLPWREHKIDRDWTDDDDAGLEEYLQVNYGIEHIRKMLSAFKLAAVNNSFHPVRDYLNSLTWDGVKRIPSLLTDYLGAEPSSYLEAVTKIHLTAAVARVMRPGIKYDTLLSLQGPQGIGKSSFIRILASPEWFNDSIERINGKETYEQLQGSWHIELGELNATRKADKDQVKQFLSKTDDIYRVAYGRRTQRFPRQCVFWGTGNDVEFLRDTTGERRYFPVRCWVVLALKDVFTELEEERDQIWAEAVHYYRNGQKLYLDYELEQEANLIRERHKEENPKIGMIQEFLDREVPVDWYTRSIEDRVLYWRGLDDTFFDDSIELMERDRICAAEIWCELFENKKGSSRPVDTKEINDIIRLIGGWGVTTDRIRFGGDYGIQRGFRRDCEQTP